MIFEIPSGCPRAERPKEKMRAMLSAASIAAIDTTPTLTTRLKHPVRTQLLSVPGSPQSRPPPNYIPRTCEKFPGLGRVRL